MPARKNPVKPHNTEQAVAVEPPMIAALEERIQSMYEAGNPRWRGLLSSWLVAFGVLRYKHFMRARPVNITQSTFHGYCPKGKQKVNRGGFSFCIPATFVVGVSPVQGLQRAEQGQAGKLRTVLRCGGHRIHTEICQ